MQWVSGYNSKDTVSDLQEVFATGQSGGCARLLLDDAIELAKGGQRSRAHPHNEVLIDKAVVLRIWWVQLIHWLPPVHRLRCAWESTRQTRASQCNLSVYEPRRSCAQFAKITLESYSKVVVSTRVPEFHMLVCPPRNSLLYQRNCISGAIGINMIQLQSVWNKQTNITFNIALLSAANELNFCKLMSEFCYVWSF